MKKIYFVRHGQSVGNLDGVRYGPDTELSKLGHKHAELVADRFKTIPLDIVLASPYKRAYDTGVAIANVANVEIELVESVRERVQPNKVIGKHRKDEQVLKIMDSLKASWLGQVNLPEGAESFYEIMNRVDNFIELINSRSEESIAVASHSGFGRQLILRVLLQDNVTPELVLDIDKRLASSNVGITTYTVDSDGNWKLEQWNDDAHLGELV